MSPLRQIVAWIGILIVVSAGWPSRASADLWDSAGRVSESQEAIREPTGFTYRGSTTFLPPQGGGGTIVDLGGSLSKGYSAFDVASSFKALFDANALEQYTIGLAAGALSSAPLLLLCYASPTLCDLYKHLKSLTQAQLAANQAFCENVQTAAEGVGRSMRSTAVKECLDREAAAGTPLHVALEQCSALDPGQTILDIKGVPIGNGTYDVVQDALKNAGASSGQIQLATAILGPVTLTTTGPGGTATVPVPPTDAVMTTYENYFAESQQNLTQLVTQVAQGQTPDLGALQALGGFGVVVTPRLLAAVSQLPPGRQELAVAKLAAALARIRLETELGEIRNRLRGVAISERGGYREDLLARAEQLEALIEHVRRIEAAQNAIAAPAQAIFDEVEREVGRGRRVATPDAEPGFPPTTFGGMRQKGGP